MKFFDTSNLRGDVFGGITTGIIALPLALAFGEASGAGPIAGVWGAIFVGFFASLFGGTGSNVSGPTGPMVVVFAGVFASLSGNPALVFAAVVLAGLLQITLGVLKMGQYIRLVPYPVVSVSHGWVKAWGTDDGVLYWRIAVCDSPPTYTGRAGGWQYAHLDPSQCVCCRQSQIIMAVNGDDNILDIWSVCHDTPDQFSEFVWGGITDSIRYIECICSSFDRLT